MGWDMQVYALGPQRSKKRWKKSHVHTMFRYPAGSTLPLTTSCKLILHHGAHPGILGLSWTSFTELVCTQVSAEAATYHSCARPRMWLVRLFPSLSASPRGLLHTYSVHLVTSFFGFRYRELSRTPSHTLLLLLRPAQVTLSSFCIRVRFIGFGGYKTHLTRLPTHSPRSF